MKKRIKIHINVKEIIRDSADDVAGEPLGCLSNGYFKGEVSNAITRLYEDTHLLSACLAQQKFIFFLS